MARLRLWALIGLLVLALGFTIFKGYIPIRPKPDSDSPRETTSIKAPAAEVSSQTDKEDSGLSEMDKKYDSYLGLWREENFSGITVWLGYSPNGEKLISASNASSKIAGFDAILTLSDDYHGTFTFDDDGWGNKGHGTIIFLEDKITVNIELDVQGSPDWGIFTGQGTFRKDLQVTN